MKQATSILISPEDRFELGDGWGGTPDCVQIVAQGSAAVSLRFSDPEQIDALISVLSHLSLDTRLRTVDTELADWHASEGRAQ